MKAERRHELKTNSLSKGLENAPAFFQQYGSRLLLGVILCLLAYILVQNHMRDKAAKAENAAKALGGALYSLGELRTLPPASPDDLARLRRDYVRDIETAINEVQANTDDPKLLAQSYIVRGDMNWQLANFPPLPGATTRPELNTDKPAEDYLNAAAESYNKVLEAPLNEDHPSVVAARLSLGKIAENKGQWDKARDYYQQVADDSSASKEFQDQARTWVEDLARLEKPVFAGAAAAPEQFGPVAPSINSLLPSAGAATTTAPALEGPASSTRPFNSSLTPATQPVGNAPTTAPGNKRPATTEPFKL